MRKFQPIFGGVVTITNVTDLDEDTVMGTMVGTNMTKIFSKKLEVFDEPKQQTNGISISNGQH